MTYLVLMRIAVTGNAENYLRTAWSVFEGESRSQARVPLRTPCPLAGLLLPAKSVSTLPSSGLAGFLPLGPPAQ
jgi:hypothetical protein